MLRCKVPDRGRYTDFGPMNELFPILDAALADAARRSGPWLACRPGCHQCCIGVFPISPLDAHELQLGLAAAPPEVAARIRSRVADSLTRLTPDFPGDATTGILFTDPEHEEAFEEFANDEVCPVLDPTSGTCDLYAHRPVQCRTFGPPMRDEEEHLTVCELCFVGAPEEEVERAEMDQSWRELEDRLIDDQDRAGDFHGPTLVAFALARR